MLEQTIELASSVGSESRIRSIVARLMAVVVEECAPSYSCRGQPIEGRAQLELLAVVLELELELVGDLMGLVARWLHGKAMGCEQLYLSVMEQQVEG